MPIDSIVPIKSASTQLLMSFRDKNGKDSAIQLNMREENAVNLLVRTARWASHNNIVIILSPVG